MIETKPTIPKDKKQGINSLELGLKVLELISAHRKPISLTTLSELTNMSPSRVYKYLVSLVKMGYISQQSDSKYSLATSSLKLGISALRQIDPIQTAFSYADKLHQTYDRTVTITIWNGDAPLVIKWLDSSRTLAVNIRLGAQLSSFTSASGRIFLAFLPEQRRKEMINDFFTNPPALPRSMGELLNKNKFIELLDIIKTEKICRFKQDFLPDINVISAPIFDADNKIVSVISLLGNSHDTPVTNESTYVQAVYSAAQAASIELQSNN